MHNPNSMGENKFICVRQFGHQKHNAVNELANINIHLHHGFQINDVSVIMDI